jgi:hypothetical protein
VRLPFQRTSRVPRRGHSSLELYSGAQNSLITSSFRPLFLEPIAFLSIGKFVRGLVRPRSGKQYYIM